MSELMGHAAAAIGSASSIFKTIKDGANAIREAKNLELYERMLAVYGDVMELVEKNRELIEQNALLREEQKIKAELQYDQTQHGYWRVQDGNREGLFCSVCWDVDSKLVRMRTYRHFDNSLRQTCDYSAVHRSKSGK